MVYSYIVPLEYLAITTLVVRVRFPLLVEPELIPMIVLWEATSSLFDKVIVPGTLIT